MIAELTGTSKSDLLRVERTERVAFSDREVGSFSVVIGLPWFIEEMTMTNARQIDESSDAAISGIHQAILRRCSLLRILVATVRCKDDGSAGATSNDESLHVHCVMSCCESSLEESVSVRAMSSSSCCGYSQLECATIWSSMSRRPRLLVVAAIFKAARRTCGGCWAVKMPLDRSVSRGRGVSKDGAVSRDRAVSRTKQCQGQGSVRGQGRYICKVSRSAAIEVPVQDWSFLPYLAPDRI
jgi:hypothetical protein